MREGAAVIKAFACGVIFRHNFLTTCVCHSFHMSRGAHRSCVRRNEPSFANFKSKERRKEDCTRSEESKTAARRSPPNSVSSSCAAPRAQVFFMKMTFKERFGFASLTLRGLTIPNFLHPISAPAANREDRAYRTCDRGTNYTRQIYYKELQVTS